MKIYNKFYFDFYLSKDKNPIMILDLLQESREIKVKYRFKDAIFPDISDFKWI